MSSIQESEIIIGDKDNQDYIISVNQESINNATNSSNLKNSLVNPEGENLVLQNGESLIISYKGVSFLVSGERFGGQEIFLGGNKDINLKVNEENLVEIVEFEHDQSILELDGKEIWLSDIQLMVEKSINLNEARKINGREEISSGSWLKTKESIAEFTNGTIAVAGGIIIGVGLPLASAAISEGANTVLETPMDKAREQFMQGFFREMGLPKMKGFSKHSDALWSGLSLLTDEEKSAYEKAQAAAEIAWEEYVESQRDTLLSKFLKKTKLGNLSDKAGKAIRDAGRETFRQTSKIVNSGFKGTPISDAAMDAAEEAIEKAIKEAQEEAIKLAKEAGLDAKAQKAAAKKAATQMEKAASEAATKSLKKGHSVEKIVTKVQKAAGKVVKNLDEVVKAVTTSIEAAAESSTVLSKVTNATRAAAKSPIFKVAGRAAVVAGPAVEVVDGFFMISDANDKLNNIEDKSKNEVSELKSERAEGISKVAIGGGGLAVGTGLLLASNPIGWGVMAGVGLAYLVDWGVKATTGKGIAERITDAAYGVEEISLSNWGNVNKDYQKALKSKDPEKALEQKQRYDEFLTELHKAGHIDEAKLKESLAHNETAYNLKYTEDGKVRETTLDQWNSISNNYQKALKSKDPEKALEQKEKYENYLNELNRTGLIDKDKLKESLGYLNDSYNRRYHENGEARTVTLGQWKDYYKNFQKSLDKGNPERALEQKEKYENYLNELNRTGLINQDKLTESLDNMNYDYNKKFYPSLLVDSQPQVENKENLEYIRTVQALVSGGSNNKDHRDGKIGAKTFMSAEANGYGEELAKLIGADYEEAKIAAANGDQSFFRKLRKENGFEERIESGFELFASKMSINPEFQNTLASLENSGRSNMASNLQNIAQKRDELFASANFEMPEYDIPNIETNALNNRITKPLEIVG